jgi:hypothetical protein
MKRIFAVLLGLAVSSTGFAKGPRIHVDAPEYNFGIADSQSVIEHTFVIKNTGDETLDVASVKSTCGCAVASLGERFVPPGGETRVGVKLTLRGRKGRLSKSILVSTNDPKKSPYRLTMAGEVRDAIQASPGRLVFSRVAPGKEAVRDIKLDAFGDKPFRILKIETDNANLKAKSDQAGADAHQKVTVRLAAPQTVGWVHGKVTITTDLPGKRTIEISVIAKVVGELIHTPAEVTIPKSSGGPPLTRYVDVRKGTADHFEIKEVIVPAGGMTAKFYPFGKEGYRIQLDNIVADEKLAGTVIRIVTSADNMKEIKVPIILR